MNSFPNVFKYVYGKAARAAEQRVFGHIVRLPDETTKMSFLRHWSGSYTNFVMQCKPLLSMQPRNHDMIKRVTNDFHRHMLSMEMQLLRVRHKK